ncbi:PA14 domain-containing protein [Spirosoma rhododendri]|uniref:PA14 domain-containing protein n=1 Tax=Spirosoma rhododendri TaxID=2728024 RepID=A0A7L5DP17_9BACT|nr:PA14 domain-containing protein [Spirosoma rhododendri]QJD80136.1 hypothetical protein HH216_18250 [Spirosoma rhododendri]
MAGRAGQLLHRGPRRPRPPAPRLPAHPGHGLRPNGQYAFAALGYAEGNPAQIKLDPRQPQARTELFAKGTTDQASRLVATDGQSVYWGGYEGVSNGGRWFVFATNASTDAEVSFASGRSLPMTHGRTYASCIDVIESTDGRMGGLAVQARGRYLFVSHPARHELRVFDKSSGSLVATEFLNDGGALAVDGQDRLWVVNGATVVRYSVSSQGRLSGVEQQLGGLVAPVSVAVSPVDGTVAVLEGGARQQLRGYRGSDGANQWVRGVAGGYLTDPVVSDEKFYVTDGLGVSDGVFVSYGADGSVWVGDGGNYRVQHYGAGSGSGGPGGLVDRIQYQPHSYSSQVVGGSGARRVLGEYLEYGIDYSKSAVDGWTLVRNWRGSIPAAYFNERSLNYLFITEIFKDVTTLSNGRTYGFLRRYTDQKLVLVELPPTGPVRFTNITFDAQYLYTYQLAPDGSLRQSLNDLSGTVGTIKWQTRPLTGFDSNNNPVWGSAVNYASAPVATGEEPINWYGGQQRTGETTASNVLVTFDNGKVNGPRGTGFHLGGIRVGTSKWLWKTARATNPNYTGEYPTDGAYDVGNDVEYGGGGVTVSGRHIFWNYHGEFWKNSQTNKWHHVYDNGLVVGSFGMTGPDAVQQAPDRSPVPGMAGNVFYGTATAGPDGAIYIYHAEEAGHGGIHRWRVDGLETIREQVIPITISASAGKGLRAQYMQGDDLNNCQLRTVRIDSTINFTWKNDGPIDNVAGGSSGRWTGYVSPPSAGTYTFAVTANRGVRLWVDGRLLIDSWTSRSTATSSGTIALGAGQYYPIRLESRGGQRLSLTWSAPGLSTQPIPSARLYPACAPDSDTTDLLDGLTMSSQLVDGQYGWNRFPVQEDSTDRESDYWTARTSIKTYDRSKSPDLYVSFRQQLGNYSVSRKLDGQKKVLDAWQLRGRVNYSGSFFSIDEGANRNGGCAIEVLDTNGRVIVQLINRVFLNRPNAPAGIYANNVPITEGSYFNEIWAVASRSQPITIQLVDGKLQVQYGKYAPVVVSAFDSLANGRQPGTVRLRFWGNNYNLARIIDVERLTFAARTVTPSQRAVDLDLSLQTNRRVVQLGEPVTFSLRLRNTDSTVSSTPIQWACRLPANLILMGGAAGAGDSLVTGSIPVLRPQADTVLTFRASARALGEYRVAAQITGSGPDPDSVPDSGTGDGQDDAAEVDVRTVDIGTAVYASANPGRYRYLWLCPRPIRVIRWLCCWRSMLRS